MGIFASSDLTRRWKRAGIGLHKQGAIVWPSNKSDGCKYSRQQIGAELRSTNAPRTPQQSKTAPQQQAQTDTRPWQRRQTSLRAREGFDVRGAREDPAGKPRSIQQKSMHRKKETEVSQYSAESGRRSEALAGALERRPVLPEFRRMRV